MDAIVVRRGHVYEFETKSTFVGKAYALVVSSDARATENIINIIILSKTYGGSQCIEVRNSVFEDGTMWINCGKITCTERARMVKDVFQLSAKKMTEVDRALAYGLGINPVEMEVENKVYKELYNDLLKRVLHEAYD